MEHKIWNREMECADRETKNAIQLDRLKKTVETCYNKVPFYKKKFDEIGLRPEHIKTLADVKHIPFTTAEDLRNNYPFGLFAVPKRDVVRIHGSSGTTGKPKIVGYTKNDLENWSEIMARVICAAGGLISMVGDLAASAIKRNHDIKDYGKLIPGHGGILDRFDSVLFTAPMIYYCILFVNEM